MADNYMPKPSKRGPYKKGTEESVADEQVIKLLEEIRDLQKAHLENQGRALRRQKTNLLLSGLFLVVFLSFMAYVGWSAGH